MSSKNIQLCPVCDGEISKDEVNISDCYRENDTVIRIISARKADKQEQIDYFGD